MGDLIDVRGVTWKRDNKTILQQVDWQVKEGENWAVLGLNGSGKTTLLNIINGYIWPTKGTVSVLGHAFGTVDLRELRKSIGWVSSSLQERMYMDQQTINLVISGKHASIGLYETPTAEDEQQAVQLMNRLGCGHLLGRVYASCSQGEKQKLLIARALMANPRLLILDEATNGLDFLSREALLTAIESIAASREAPGLLLVTHHIEEILPIYTHTILIRQGEVFAQGLTTDMLTPERLSSFFDVTVDVRWANGRAWLSLA